MSIRYCSHIQDIGWQNYVNEGEISGTTGLSKRMEAIKIDFYHPHVLGTIQYSVHVQNIGWMEFVGDNEVAGTTGQSLRIEAIKIRLTGDSADMYDIYYQCHVQNIGWMGWAKNGEEAGTTGYAYRCEAIKIVLVFKNGPAPGSTINCFKVNPYSLFRYPVSHIGVTTRYSPSHYGIDLGWWSGNPNPPIYAAVPGIVRDINYNGSAGNYVTVVYDDVDNNCTWYTNYKHLNSFNVLVNQIVETGTTQIGVMGTTGDSSGVHLHFDLVRVPLYHVYNPNTERATYSRNPFEYLYKYSDQTLIESGGNNILTC